MKKKRGTEGSCGQTKNIAVNSRLKEEEDQERGSDQVRDWMALLLLILPTFRIFDRNIMNMTGRKETIKQATHGGEEGTSSIHKNRHQTLLSPRQPTKTDSDIESFFTTPQSLSSASSSYTSTHGKQKHCLANLEALLKLQATS